MAERFETEQLNIRIRVGMSALVWNQSPITVEVPDLAKEMGTGGIRP